MRNPSKPTQVGIIPPDPIQLTLGPVENLRHELAVKFKWVGLHHSVTGRNCSVLADAIMDHVCITLEMEGHEDVLLEMRNRTLRELRESLNSQVQERLQ